MRHRLIVNADDYGLTMGVSGGIREAHLGGIVSSTTVMMNMPGIYGELEKALRNTPKLGLGIHFNLTIGRPVSRSDLVPSLVDGEGRFWGLGEFAGRSDEIELDEVLIEWQAQAERFVEMTGRNPTHFDSHHHISYFTPGLFRWMLRLGQEYRCGIRSIFSPAEDMDYTFLPRGQLPEMREFTRSIAMDEKIRIPDAFVGSFFGAGATSETLMALLKGLTEEVTELMCHAGYADRALIDNSSYNVEREGELAILTDPEVMATVRREKIDLIPFDEI